MLDRTGEGARPHVSLSLFLCYPIPSSPAASSGVPQRRQITAPQSPQVSGSETSEAHFGQ